MAKNYIEGTTTIYNKNVTLSELVDKINTINTNITNLKNSIDNIGKTTYSQKSNIYCTQSTNTTINSITINDPGTYVVFGGFEYQDANLSYHLELNSDAFLGYPAISALDDAGWCHVSVMGIFKSTSKKEVNLVFWPRNKSVTIYRAHMSYIRIK